MSTPGLVGENDFEQLHLVDGGEVVHADDILGPGAGLGDLTDRQRRCVRGKNAVRSNMLLNLISKEDG